MIIYDKWGGENLETCLELEQYRGSNQMAEVRRPYEISSDPFSRYARSYSSFPGNRIIVGIILLFYIFI